MDTQPNNMKRIIEYQQAERNDARRLNLNVWQYHAACIIYFAPDQCMRYYADKLGIKNADMTHLVDKLVSVGLVKRSRTLLDHRLVIISLTDKGKSKIGAVMNPQITIARPAINHDLQVISVSNFTNPSHR